MCSTSINYPLFSFTFYSWHFMGRVVSGLGWVGYGMRCDLLVHALKVRPPSFPSRAWGNSLFSAAWQNPFARAHRLAGSSILACTTFVSFFSKTGSICCARLQRYLWDLITGVRVVHGLIQQRFCVPTSYCWPSSPMLEKPEILVTNLSCQGQVLLLLQRAAPDTKGSSHSEAVVGRIRMWEKQRSVKALSLCHKQFVCKQLQIFFQCFRAW